MNDHRQKGIKRFFLKYMALFIGLCYLANPLHQEIRVVFHEVVHFLEAPQSVISHSHPGSEQGHIPHENGARGAVGNRAAGHHLGLVEYFDGPQRDHRAGSHRMASDEPDHEHHLLDLMASLFDASDGEHSDDESPLPLTKWDKHIASQDYLFPKNYPTIASQGRSAPEQKVHLGYLSFLDEPPQ